MKKIILLSVLTFLFFKQVFPVLSLEEKATNSALKNEELEKIRELKEKVAGKVAELKEKELSKVISAQTKIYSGVIKKIEEEKIILEKETEDLTVETSDKTKFIWINTDGRKLNITFKDFTVGDKIVAWGNINKDTGIMTARVISGRLRPFVFSCLTSKIELENGEKLSPRNKILSCRDKNKGKDYQLLIPETSKIFIWQKTKGLEKLDIENIKIGMRLIVKGVTKEKDKGKITALLIISF